MRGRSKSRYAEKTCHYYKKKGNIKADCYTLKNRNKVAMLQRKESNMLIQQILILRKMSKVV